MKVRTAILLGALCAALPLTARDASAQDARTRALFEFVYPGLQWRSTQNGFYATRAAEPTIYARRTSEGWRFSQAGQRDTITRAIQAGWHIDHSTGRSTIVRETADGRLSGQTAAGDQRTVSTVAGQHRESTRARPRAGDNADIFWDFYHHRHSRR